MFYKTNTRFYTQECKIGCFSSFKRLWDNPPVFVHFVYFGKCLFTILNLLRWHKGTKKGATKSLYLITPFYPIRTN